MEKHLLKMWVLFIKKAPKKGIVSP